MIEITPKPDVPTVMRKLPQRPKKAASQLGPDQVAIELPAPAKTKPALVEPLAPARYKVQFTANAEFHAKLERLQALMRSSVPDGDLAAIIEEAVSEKLERLEAKRFGKTTAPRKSVEETDTSPSSRYIPAAVRRTVSERDGNRCTFVDGRGRRCRSRNALQFHHDEAFALGGDHSPDNVQMMCPAHNQYLAERTYGKEVMGRFRRSDSRAREPGPVYSGCQLASTG